MKKTYEVPNAKMNTRVPHRIENKIPSLNSWLRKHKAQDWNLSFGLLKYGSPNVFFS